MASQKQIEANRRNAQLSTGPRTPEGKAITRLNALQTGIYITREVVSTVEDIADLRDLTEESYDRFQPTAPEQRRLVDRLISDEWMLRRFGRTEAATMSQYTESTLRECDTTAIGAAFYNCVRQLDVLQRRINATLRSYRKALQTLNELQAAAQPTIQPEPARRPIAPSNQPVPGPIGFVPPDSPNALQIPSPRPVTPAPPAERAANDRILMFNFFNQRNHESRSSSKIKSASMRTASK